MYVDSLRSLTLPARQCWLVCLLARRASEGFHRFEFGTTHFLVLEALAGASG